MTVLLQRRTRGAWRMALSLAVLGAAGVRSQPVEPEGCFADCTSDLRGDADSGPLAGTPAPLFEATGFDPVSGERRPIDLPSLLTDRPLILAFGSFT